MSDSVTVTVRKLGVGATIKDGISIGIKNIIPILVNGLLWGLTFWIPYLNIGTTIGLWVGIIAKAANGEAIPLTEIFNPKYRKYMGEYFLTSALIGMGVFAGFLMFIFPGIIIAITWSLSLLLVVDKGKNPTEAMTMSNDYTYGNKGKMFCVYFLVFLAYAIVILLAALIMTKAYRIFMLGMILSFVATVFLTFLLFGLQASIYGQLMGSRAVADTFCGNCGAKNDPGTKFCGGCGAKLE